MHHVEIYYQNHRYLEVKEYTDLHRARTMTDWSYTIGYWYTSKVIFRLTLELWQKWRVSWFGWSNFFSAWVLGFWLNNLIGDNQETLHIASNIVSPERIKHFKVDYDLDRRRLLDNVVDIVYVKSKDKLEDLLVKLLGCLKVIYNCKKLHIWYICPNLRENNESIKWDILGFISVIVFVRGYVHQIEKFTSARILY